MKRISTFEFFIHNKDVDQSLVIDMEKEFNAALSQIKNFDKAVIKVPARSEGNMFLRIIFDITENNDYMLFQIDNRNDSFTIKGLGSSIPSNNINFSDFKEYTTRPNLDKEDAIKELSNKVKEFLKNYFK